MNLPRCTVMSLSSLLFLIMLGYASAHASDIQRITVEELKALLKSKDVVIIDVRPKAQFDSSKDKLPGAVNENPFEARDWGGKYSKEDPTVLYCA